MGILNWFKNMARKSRHVGLLASTGTSFDWSNLDSSSPPLDTSDENGWTVLHWAAFWGRCDNVPALVERGADMDAVSNENPDGVNSRKVMRQAWQRNRPADVIHISEAAEVMISFMQFCVAHESLLTPLQVAVRTLISTKVSEPISELFGDLRRYQWEHIPFQRNHLDVAQMLLERGAGVGQVASDELTAAQFAEKYDEGGDMFTLLSSYQK